MRHPAGMSIVWNGTKHGEHQMTADIELLVGIHTPEINHSHLLARHLDVVVMRNATPQIVPFYGMMPSDIPTIILCIAEGREA